MIFLLMIYSNYYVKKEKIKIIIMLKKKNKSNFVCRKINKYCNLIFYDYSNINYIDIYY